MKILIATDLALAYVAKQDYVDGLDLLFMWLDKLHYHKYIDMATIAILTHFYNVDKYKPLNDFMVLRETPEMSQTLKKLNELLKTQYDEKELRAIKKLMPQLLWLDKKMVDYVITENDYLFSMAKAIGIDYRVYSIENFIEKLSIEHRDLDPYKSLRLKVEKMEKLDINDRFFNTFKQEYFPYYCDWFKKKGKDSVYVSRYDNDKIQAILKLKIENEKEDYSNISPIFSPQRRLKICSLKVEYTGQKMGERFLFICFQTAIDNAVEQIYITIFPNSSQRKRLVGILKQWGFFYWGTKDNNEHVYVKDMQPSNKLNIRENYPFCSFTHSGFIIPIHKLYASDLLPSFDINDDNDDVAPYKCSIKKVLTLYADNAMLRNGSVLMFYNMSSNKAERGVIAIGIAENVYRNFENSERYLSRCRKRSILDKATLMDCWVKNEGRIVVVDFLLIHRFSKIIELSNKSASSLLTGNQMRQIPIQIDKEQYKEIIKDTKYESYNDFD